MLRYADAPAQRRAALARRGARRLLDGDEANAFLKSWGIGVGMGQVSELQGLVTSTAQLVAGIALLEMLWVATNSTWAESNLDYLSFQATLPHHTHGEQNKGAPSKWSVREYSRFSKGIA